MADSIKTTSPPGRAVWPDLGGGNVDDLLAAEKAAAKKAKRAEYDRKRREARGPQRPQAGLRPPKTTPAALRPLTKTQLAVRALLVKYKGDVTDTQMAREIGISREHVTMCRKAIRERRPVALEQFVEADLVRGIIGSYDDHETFLFAELERNDLMIEHWGTHPAAIGFLNVRLGLLRQMAECRAARERFMLAIGLVRKAPEEIIVHQRELPELNGPDLYEEMDRLDYLIEDLTNGSRDSRSGPPPEAEALPLLTEGDDQLQGPGRKAAG